MARFLLVHGAFHGAWCWDRVAHTLRSHGHTVTAIDLPGSGSDTTPLDEVTLDLYRERIVDELRGSPEPVVLVGHSMSGVAITAAASDAPDLVAQLVYVSAFLPAPGESIMALAAKPEGAGAPGMVVSGEPPVARIPASNALDIFYGECAPEAAAAAAARLGPQAMHPFFAPTTTESAHRPIRRYVLTLRDRALPLALQRRMVADSPCEEVVEMDTDHSPFLSRPDELTAHLSRFAST